MILTRERISSYAHAAGFEGNDINIAVAIALAESGGDTQNHNYDTTTRDDSYGLWQINMYEDLGPARRKQFGLKNNEVLFNPSVNADVAYKIYKDRGWTAWTTYKKGKHVKFLKDDAKNVAEGDAKIDEANKETENGLFGIPGAIQSVGANLFKGVSNVAGILVAVVLLVLGIVILMREPIMKVVPAGKVGKLIK